MVRANVFQKCCHSGKIERRKQIRGLIQGQNEFTSWFEPRQPFCLKVGDFLGQSDFLGNELTFVGDVFFCG
ncbi:MAG: hypothetical protein A2542_04015 [Parcubacteria group bacterium RIFOXYD2_FULL_52_8]|nr:MAG: hypothetical protein A2542_04015 [Parcubacteria group bacterium RIFOXYD2_FULL_52_8]